MVDLRRDEPVVRLSVDERARRLRTHTLNALRREGFVVGRPPYPTMSPLPKVRQRRLREYHRACVALELDVDAIARLHPYEILDIRNIGFVGLRDVHEWLIENGRCNVKLYRYLKQRHDTFDEPDPTHPLGELREDVRE